MEPIYKNPTTVGELRANKDFYLNRLEEWNSAGDNSLGRNVLFPRRGASEMAVKAFHEAMTEEGFAGIEYAQEALHGNGDYFDETFDSLEEFREDMRRFKEL
jgi:hypothetical protein